MTKVIATAIKILLTTEATDVVRNHHLVDLLPLLFLLRGDPELGVKLVDASLDLVGGRGFRIRRVRGRGSLCRRGRLCHQSTTRVRASRGCWGLIICRGGPRTDESESGQERRRNRPGTRIRALMGDAIHGLSPRRARTLSLRLGRHR